jgi:hypothetical protein
MQAYRQTNMRTDQQPNVPTNASKHAPQSVPSRSFDVTAALSSGRTSSHFGTFNVSSAPLKLVAPIVATTISNRHRMQLEITASRTESTASLFLIVPKRTLCARQWDSQPGCHLPTSHSAASTHPSRAARAILISNRHLVRLEITASPAKSTSSLFLIDPKRPQLSTSSTRSSSQPPLQANADRSPTTQQRVRRLMPVPARSRIAVWEERFSARREEWQ